jgi:hypothetical protein
MPMGDRTGPRGEGPMTGRGAGYCAKNKTQKDGPGRKLGPRRGKRRLGRGLGLRRDLTVTVAVPENSLTTIEKTLVEAIGNIFKNNESTLGIVPHKEISHGFEFQWNGIEDMFAIKTAKSTFHEELTSAFRDIHSYKYLDDPTFTIALKKRLTARGIPTEEVNNAILYCKEIIETIQKEDFQEKQSGWHPNIDEIADMTRNAENRTPKKEAPYTGGGPAPARNEIS